LLAQGTVFVFSSSDSSGGELVLQDEDTHAELGCKLNSDVYEAARRDFAFGKPAKVFGEYVGVSTDPIIQGMALFGNCTVTGPADNVVRPAQVPVPGAAAIAVTVEGDSPNHRVKIDEPASDNEPQFVRSLEGAWSKPTFLYSDDNVKVYMPFDDQLALGASIPERSWTNSSFEVLLFSSKGRAPTGKWAATWEAPVEYTEQRVLIDTAKLKYTIVATKLIDGSGHVFQHSPDDWAGEVRNLATSQWPTSRSITDEIVRRLTEPQRSAMKVLNFRSLDELARDQLLHRQYLAFMKDQTARQRGLGPEHSQQ